MPAIFVLANAADPRRGTLRCAEDQWPCVLGRSGVISAEAKREGDGATPLGSWPLRRLLYRAERLSAAPQTTLPKRSIFADDGWCDQPDDRAYNRPVRLPYPARHERLMREDGLYDLIVVLGHNDDPPACASDDTGLGSAIFLHCAKTLDGALADTNTPVDALQPTEGCIALARAHLLQLLARASRGDTLSIALSTA